MRPLLHRLFTRYRGWEYWNTYIFELPAYCRLAFQLLRYRLSLSTLTNANWALDHGGFAFASKFDIQSTFPTKNFPPTILVDSNTSSPMRILPK